MNEPIYTRWQTGGWRGWIDVAARVDPAACLQAMAVGGRRSRHAWTNRLVAGASAVYVKAYPAPDGWRATHAFRMGRRLVRAGFAAPLAVLVARRGGGGLLVTRDVGGDDVAAAMARRRGDLAAKRDLLRRLGDAVGRLHAAGFVHGDLVPPNVHLAAERLVFLDNDRTRHSRVLVWFGGRRNLVQLGRFVVPGVTLTDRARVLAAYAAARRVPAGARRRLARWLVQKTMARRCAIDHIPVATAARAGFRAVMRSGGPFDQAGDAPG